MILPHTIMLPRWLLLNSVGAYVLWASKHEIGTRAKTVLISKPDIGSTVNRFLPSLNDSVSAFILGFHKTSLYNKPPLQRRWRIVYLGILIPCVLRKILPQPSAVSKWFIYAYCNRYRSWRCVSAFSGRFCEFCYPRDSLEIVLWIKPSSRVMRHFLQHCSYKVTILMRSSSDRRASGILRQQVQHYSQTRVVNSLILCSLFQYFDKFANGFLRFHFFTDFCVNWSFQD